MAVLLAAGASWQSTASAGTQPHQRGAVHGPAVVRVVVPADMDVTTTVLSKDAGDELGYGLRQPVHIGVCRSCGPGDSKDLGSFPDEQVLVFFLRDDTHGTSYSSNNRAHARLVKTTRYTWVISWDDAGGDKDFNDLVTSITLTPN